MIKRVAQRLNVSARTLQRRLREGGTSYTKLVDEIRFKLACRLLDAPRTSITDVAAAVGYGDSSSFSRSFARWSGMQPKAYRRLRARQGRSGASVRRLKNRFTPHSPSDFCVGALKTPVHH